MSQAEPMVEAVVTLGLSSHIIEVLPLAEPLMRTHDLVVLEEPALPGFQEMLEEDAERQEGSYARAACVRWWLW